MPTTIHRAKVLAGNKKFMAAFSQKNAGGLAKLYTKGGQLLPPGSDMVTGGTAIQAFWQGALDAGLAQVTLDTVEVEGHRDTAIEVGRYTLRRADGQVADTGKYLVIWKVEGRSWKLHRDIWNTSSPAPSAGSQYMDDMIADMDPGVAKPRRPLA